MSLSLLRLKAGFSTQAQFGERLGVSRVQVTKWENGQRKPKIDMVRKMSEALGVSESEVIDAILEK